MCKKLNDSFRLLACFKIALGLQLTTSKKELIQLIKLSMIHIKHIKNQRINVEKNEKFKKI